jgi:starch phosphorylase
MDGILHSIRNPHDEWMTAADFRAFVDAQHRAADTFRDRERWTAISIRNTAASGRFSTDRTMRDYNDDLWHLQAIDLGRP